MIILNEHSIGGIFSLSDIKRHDSRKPEDFFFKFPFPFENNLLFADNTQAIKGMFFLFVCFVKLRL